METGRRRGKDESESPDWVGDDALAPARARGGAGSGHGSAAQAGAADREAAVAGRGGARADEAVKVPVVSGETDEPDGAGVAYRTEWGRCVEGDARTVLPRLIREGVRARLIVTSPPFALVRKKAYGNEDADRYLRWFAPLIPLFRDILTPDGSFVIELGGVWRKGVPVRSLYQYEVLMALCRQGFWLAQEFYHYNPARLPTPAEWVTVRRIRVKDAVNHVWWLVKDPWAKADNRRVLKPYSEAMQDLLRRGYTPRRRPSGHEISGRFRTDNGGAIPSNVLQWANTESNSAYLRRCKAAGLTPHPARFPKGLPEFFIKLCTDPGDLVLDPFAGSNVTGAVAEGLGRRWIAIERESAYVRGSRLRFEAPMNAGSVSEQVTTLRRSCQNVTTLANVVTFWQDPAKM